MKRLKETITVTPNYSRRTFTIRKTYLDGYKIKYRTAKMNDIEFESCLNNTQRDWIDFLNNTDEYTILSTKFN